MTVKANRLAWSLFFFSISFVSIRVIKMWDLRKNYTAHRQDPVPLQTYPYPGSCMRMRLGSLSTIPDNTLFYWNMQTAGKRWQLFWHVLQVIPDLFWTPRDPTSSVTALMIASTCSTSAELKRLQVKKDSTLAERTVHLCQSRHFPVRHWFFAVTYH